VFDAFFTTKESGGTGQGCDLAIDRRRSPRHADFDSKVGRHHVLRADPDRGPRPVSRSQLPDRQGRRSLPGAHDMV